MVDFESNLKLVEYVFYKKFKNYYYCKDDFMQVGRLALWKATKKFDESKGEFSTFAVKIIKNDMISYAISETKYNSMIKDIPENCTLEYEDDGVDLRKYKLQGLSPFEKYIVKLFMIGYNFKEIGKLCDFTPQYIGKRIRELKNKIILEK